MVKLTPHEIIEQTLFKYGFHAAKSTLADAIVDAVQAAGYRLVGPAKFALGDRVTKIKGSSWTGRVVGFYSTSFTPVGYAVESENEPGSVQIYSEAALRALPQEAKP